MKNLFDLLKSSSITSGCGMVSYAGMHWLLNLDIIVVAKVALMFCYLTLFGTIGKCLVEKVVTRKQ